jgi:hypothetical protein
MGIYKTKHFGEIFIDSNKDFEYINAKININGIEKDIIFTLCDCNIYENKIKNCLEIIDEYYELNNKAKEIIINEFENNNKTIIYYLKWHFNTLDKKILEKIFDVIDYEQINIKNIVNKLDYPELVFTIHNREIAVSVNYIISAEYSEEILCIKMNEEINVINFSVES